MNIIEVRVAVDGSNNVQAVEVQGKNGTREQAQYIGDSHTFHQSLVQVLGEDLWLSLKALDPVLPAEEV